MFFSSLKQHKKTTGVTLVELMIAIVISSILVLGIAEIFKLNKRSSKISDDSARMQESGRFAFNMIMQDLRRAGYYGGNANITKISGSSAIVTPPTNTCPNNTTWGRMLERRVIGLNDTGGAYACLSADYVRGDVIVMRYTEGRDLSAVALDANRFYVRSSLFDGRLFVGSAAANVANNVSTSPNNVQLLSSQAYYIGDAQDNGADRLCSFQNSTLKIPALFREVLNNAGVPVQEEVASGIEHLQVQYGVDRSASGDGEVNTYYNADLINNNTTTPNWTQVVSVRFWVLARAECPTSSYNNTKTYSMGDTNYTVNDGFKRQLYSTTVALRNGN